MYLPAILALSLLHGASTAIEVIESIEIITTLEGYTTEENTSEENSNTVNLTLFYESYCPFSIDFFVKELYPTWEEYKDYINLDLVPFGNAKQSYVENHYVFKCQHGRKECVGNMLHACAIHEACGVLGTLNCPADKLAKAMDYIYCVMRNKNQQTASDECASQAALEPKVINKCANGTLGQTLHSAYGNQTVAFNNPKRSYVPFIIINGTHTEEEQDEARTDLKSLIWKYVQEHVHK